MYKQDKANTAFLIKLLQNGLTIELIAGGRSMFPYLRKHDVLKIEKVPIDTVSVGQIICFSRKDKLIAHRVIKIENKNKITLYAKGDATKQIDEPISENNYQGLVTEYIRKNKSYTIDYNNKKHKNIAAISPYTGRYIYQFLYLIRVAKKGLEKLL